MGKLLLPLLAGMLVASTGAAHAQAGPTYAPAADSIVVEDVNPYRMYWVIGSDTVGRPVESTSRETQWWTPSGAGIQVIVRREVLQPTASIRTDTFNVEPNGRLLTINGRAPGLNEEVDFLPRLPNRPFSVGTRWADTLRVTGRGPPGERVFAITREYHMARTLDTLGSTIVEIEAAGQVHYRDGWWTDSTHVANVWIDVQGPVTERIGFDPARRQVVYRLWEMRLTGEGGVPYGRGGELRVPAGLLSASRTRLIPAEAADALRRHPPMSKPGAP